MMIEKPLVDKDYLLQKFEGKGGFSDVRLMPLGNGHLFMAIKLAIRKKLKKQAGDTVHIILYKDNLPTEIPEELILCMKYEDGILEKFEKYSDGEKFYNWKTQQEL